MKRISIIFRHRRAIRNSVTVMLLLIALAFMASHQQPGRAAHTVNTQAVVTPPPTVPMLTGTFAAVNNGPSDQTNPHVDCNRVSYTNDDFQGSSTIHYFDFSTGMDNVIPGNGLDRLSDLSGTRIAFSELSPSLGVDQIVLFDTATQTRTVLSGPWCSNPALGGNVIAFEDRKSFFTNPGEIDVYAPGINSVNQLTNDALFDKGPAVSATGNTIVWEKCQTASTGCDIYVGFQVSPGGFATGLLTGAAGEDHRPDTNDEIVVYTSTRGGETDIYYQPLSNAPEVQIAIPGDQRDVRISGNLIVFESQTATGYDVFVYDLSSGRLYQVTNTPGVDETLSDISVCNGVGRIVYAVAGGFGDFDVYAFTFQVPSSVQPDVNDLIAVVNSFELPHGIKTSLVAKLKDALSGLATADTATACDALMSFSNECSAQSGKTLTEEQAAQLINAATQVRAVLGCP